MLVCTGATGRWVGWVPWWACRRANKFIAFHSVDKRSGAPRYWASTPSESIAIFSTYTSNWGDQPLTRQIPPSGLSLSPSLPRSPPVCVCVCVHDRPLVHFASKLKLSNLSRGAVSGLALLLLFQYWAQCMGQTAKIILTTTGWPLVFQPASGR